MKFKCPNCGKMISSANLICPYCRGKDRYDLEDPSVQIKCQSCGKKIGASNRNCPYCQSENPLSDGEITALRLKSKEKRRTFKIIAILTVFVMIAGFCVSCSVLPHKWNPTALKNRAAILKYAKANYPGAKIVKEYYPSTKFNPTGDPYDFIWFELDGLQFFIEARHGECYYYNDGYGYALIQREIRENYLNDFFTSRGLPYEPDIALSYAGTGVYEPPGKDASLDTFPGDIRLDLLLDFEEDKPTPRDFGWFYEFYLYWKEVCPTDGFTIRFCYRINKNSYLNLYCYSTSKFKNADDFYDQFK